MGVLYLSINLMKSLPASANFEVTKTRGTQPVKRHYGVYIGRGWKGMELQKCTNSYSKVRNWFSVSGSWDKH